MAPPERVALVLPFSLLDITTEDIDFVFVDELFELIKIVHRAPLACFIAFATNNVASKLPGRLWNTSLRNSVMYGNLSGVPLFTSIMHLIARTR